MILNAKNKQVTIGGTKMDYISFGTGADVLVIIPGLGDGIRTVKGMAFTIAMMYRQLAKKFRVYVFSRKRDLPNDYSIEAMADDLKIAFDLLDIKSAHVLGVSQGGMIAQWLTIKYPGRVKKLILAVTMARQNDTVTQVVNDWIALAKANDFRGLLMDTAAKTYAPKLLKTYRHVYAIATKLIKPKDFTRFIIQAQACLAHDAYDRLHDIACPTLVIGGAKDEIVGKDAAKEISDSIKHSKLLIYEQYGHGAYEEAKDFQQVMIRFLNEGSI